MLLDVEIGHPIPHLPWTKASFHSINIKVISVKILTVFRYTAELALHDNTDLEAGDNDDRAI